MNAQTKQITRQNSEQLEVFWSFGLGALQRPFDEIVCDALIANGDVKTVKKDANVCDGGAIKHGSDFSCVCDVGHTVQLNELFAMGRNKRNGQPDEGVCDIEHTVHSDELFVIRQHKINGQPDQGVCDTRQTGP